MPAPMVPLVPNAYRIAAILNLKAQQLYQKTQGERQKHEAAVQRHSTR